MARNPVSSPARVPRQSRPADRRDIIVRTAAEAFSAKGYHAVHLEEIADRVGVSTPALYRHFPSKYAVFVAAARHLVAELSAAIDSVPAGGRPPGEELADLLDALTVAAVDNRREGGLYRWELRYLRAPDSDHVREFLITQHRRIRSLVRSLRPGMDTREADVLTAALTSVVASPATHRTVMSTRDIRALIGHVVTTLAGAEPTSPVDGTDVSHAGLAPASKRELVLAEAIRLFSEHGFGDVTVEQIAQAAGLPTSGVYRHFDSKITILEAAFWRASDRVTASITDALATSTTPRDATVGLVERYTALSLANTGMISMYLSELGHVRPPQRAALRNQQRVNVEEWAAWLRRDRPALTPAQSRFLVQAALNLVADLSRLPHPPSGARITELACRVLHDTTEGVTAASDGLEIVEEPRPVPLDERDQDP